MFQAFKKLGHDVSRFSWHQYFLPAKGPRWLQPLDRFVKKLQNKLIWGPLVYAINRDFAAAVERCRPDMVFLYRGTHISGRVLRQIKSRCKHIFWVGYNNDDPFAAGHPYLLWRHFLKAVPEYDLMLAYRQHNLEDFRKAGAKQVRLLRSWFVPERNHPVVLSPEEVARYQCDVVFIGHYEPDGRLELLEEIVRRGYSLRLFGPGFLWGEVIRKSPVLSHFFPVSLVWGEDYNKALCGAKVALCFLSKLNRDTYTRRCFEIPATGTLLLSEYSADLAGLYKEGEEADFFRDKDELIKKIEYYVQNEFVRRDVAQAGYNRVYGDGHDVASRMEDLIDFVRQRGCQETLN